MAPPLPRPAAAPLDAPVEALVRAFAGRPGTAWLDSGRRMAWTGRWSFLTLPPLAILEERGGRLAVARILPEGRWGAGEVGADPDPGGVLSGLAGLSGEQVLPGLEAAMRLLGLSPWPADAAPGDDLPPLCGGLVGFFSYDLGRRFERFSDGTTDDQRVPDLALAVHDAVIALDHDRGRALLVQCLAGADPDDPREVALLRHRARAIEAACAEPPPPPEPPTLLGPPRSDQDAHAYRERVAAIRQRIATGEVYQVNFSQRFAARFRGDPLGAYLRLREVSPAPCGAFLRLPGIDVASNSPERFLAVRGERVSSRPIKGTRPRHADPRRDRAAREELLRSEKDRAELTMIVDLVRNDLGRIARAGTVEVPVPREIESYATVHHGVAEVRARLQDGTSPLDWMRAAFPPGSVTGCPKVRALDVIDRLERHRRGVYCGAIGYLSFTGSAELNVAIRTATFRAGLVTYGVGGGVVWDSDPDEEHRESLAKGVAWARAPG